MGCKEQGALGCAVGSGPVGTDGAPAMMVFRDATVQGEQDPNWRGAPAAVPAFPPLCPSSHVPGPGRTVSCVLT